MKSLLVLACSNRKTLGAGRKHALEVYDGGAFRLIRKHKREGSFPPNTDIAILSARFGLISESTLIAKYDLRMDEARAIALRSEVQASLRNLLSTQNYSEAYIDLGKTYLLALEGFVMPDELIVVFGKGRIGERLNGLKGWLSKRATL